MQAKRRVPTEVIGFCKRGKTGVKNRNSKLSPGGAGESGQNQTNHIGPQAQAWLLPSWAPDLPGKCVGQRASPLGPGHAEWAAASALPPAEETLGAGLSGLAQPLPHAPPQCRGQARAKRDLGQVKKLIDVVILQDGRL